MGLINYFSRKMREHSEARREIAREYNNWYSDCFKGSLEQVELKLHIWDSVHRATRR
jgi:hypothetical protein